MEPEEGRKEGETGAVIHLLENASYVRQNELSSKRFSQTDFFSASSSYSPILTAGLVRLLFGSLAQIEFPLAARSATSITFRLVELNQANERNSGGGPIDRPPDRSRSLDVIFLYFGKMD